MSLTVHRMSGMSEEKKAQLIAERDAEAKAWDEHNLENYGMTTEELRRAGTRIFSIQDLWRGHGNLK